jgi:hypothetical protein
MIAGRMMAVFDMVTNPPADIAQQLSDESDEINDFYFTVDTAPNDVIMEWVRFNRHMVTYATYQGHVMGFYNLMPLTQEAGELFLRQALKEEDIRVEHILPHDAMPFCQYAYLAAIAVKDTKHYISRQCVAAMMGTMADHLLNGYNPQYFKKVFANPTTFDGNIMVHKLGLKPVDTMKKALKENDIYAITMDEGTRDALKGMSDRYGRFVGQNPWAAKTKKTV